MNTYSIDRSEFAAKTLVYLAIAFGTLAFWSDALATGDAVDFLIAALLTAANLAVSLLLSGVVARFAEAKEKQAPRTAQLAIAMGAVLILLEAGMTTHGLFWLDARRHLADGRVLVVAAFGLSAFNVFALYTFAREIPKPKPLGATPALPNLALVQADRPVDPDVARVMKDIGRQVRRRSR